MVKIASNRSDSVPSIFRRHFKNKQAATLIEYSLIAGLIATATVSGMGAVGNGLLFVMGSAANAMH
jgi:Flp pilus assembly pilin Flp